MKWIPVSRTLVRCESEPVQVMRSQAIRKGKYERKGDSGEGEQMVREVIDGSDISVVYVRVCIIPWYIHLIYIVVALVPLSLILLLSKTVM